MNGDLSLSLSLSLSLVDGYIERRDRDWKTKLTI
jgi:hypothetical protein